MEQIPPPSVTPAEAALVADEVPGSVVALSFDYPGGLEVLPHRHRRHQLVFSVRGVLTVATDGGSWVLPAGRALWVPAGVEHSIRTTGVVRLRTVYFDPQVGPRLSPECRVLEVPRLLGELIVRAVELGPTLVEGERPLVSQALLDLLFEELERAHQAPLLALHLPKGSDHRLRRLTEALSREPADPATLSEWGRRVGASERSLSRLFAAETGLTFTRWRQHLRLQRALELLALGSSVTEVALDVGYDSMSAFISAFRRATGQTPGAYRARSRHPGYRTDRGSRRGAHPTA